MPLKKKIYNLYRKYFGTYEIEDPRPIAKKNPYTYYLPSQARIEAIEPGDGVKLVFVGSPNGLKYGLGERMWVGVETISGDDFVGILQNVPSDMPQIKHGDEVKFKRWHIIDTDWKLPEKEEIIPKEPSKQVWDRCMVDQEVLDGTARVGYLYREEPDLAGDDDKYPDSGWRIRADTRDLTDEEYENPKPAYIAIGKVLNQDDTWLHLIESDIGSKFLRNQETNEFEITD